MGIRTSKGTVQVQEVGTWYSKYGDKNELRYSTSTRSKVNGTLTMRIRTSKGTVQVQEVGIWYSKYGDKNE